MEIHFKQKFFSMYKTEKYLVFYVYTKNLQMKDHL